MYSKIIKNAQVIDGTGSHPRLADVAIEQDKIVEVGDLSRASAQEVIDGTGSYLAPGFIDIQNHSDVYWLLFDRPGADSMLAQGITTIAVGSCGASLAPLLGPDALLSIQKWHDLKGVNVNWATVGEYLKELSNLHLGVNVATLVGYSTMRRGIIGDEVRALDETEQAVLQRAIRESIASGAFGVSSGLSYTHESAITTPELLALAQTVKECEALLSVHLRSEGQKLTESVEEALQLTSKTGVSLKISHFKSTGKDNWSQLPEAIGLIEDAYQKHSSVLFDVYPYDFVWQILYTYLPKWAYQGGRAAMLANLKDPEKRAKVLAHLTTTRTDYSQLIVASTTMPLNVNGKTLSRIAASQGTTSEEALLTTVEHGGSEVMVFDHVMDMAQVRELLAHPLSMVATDGAGFPVDWEHGLVHPRSFGSMPAFLEMSVLPIHKAIQKITSTPAQKLGIEKRGKIEPGFFADLVMFSPDVKARATEVNPYKFPTGIQTVIVNGATAVDHGQLVSGRTPRSSGRVLRK